MCDITHSFVRHDSFVTRASQTSARCSIDYCARTVERLSHARTMGWLRSVGSIQLWVSFAENCPFYRALLQKKPIIYSILSNVRLEIRKAATLGGCQTTKCIHKYVYLCICIYIYTYIYMYIFVCCDSSFSNVSSLLD